jgi:phosphoribosylformimino-5-aminoimidazole carboxamide ribotide isomerase
VILLPAIDIRGGRVVRLLQGNYLEETAYDENPAAAAERWAADGARYVHVVDLDGARSGRPVNLDAVRRIAERVAIPFQAGGGLRDAGAVEALLEAGADRIVIGTAALRDRPFLDAMLAEHGERVVVSIDARGLDVALAGWEETSGADPAETVARLAQRGVRRFLFTPIEVDGTLAGPDTAELRRVAEGVDAEVIYSGGVGSLAHLRRLLALGLPNVTGVIVGRALYERRFSVADAQAALDETVPG